MRQQDSSFFITLSLYNFKISVFFKAFFKILFLLFFDKIRKLKAYVLNYIISM